MWPFLKKHRPYTVLGSLDATTVRGVGQDAESAVQDAARVAKRMGADAIIVTGSGKEQVGAASLEVRPLVATIVVASLERQLAIVFTDAPTEMASQLQICLVRPLAPIKGRRQC